MDLLHQAAELMARGDVPAEIMESVRLGRMTALRKPNGRVRGIVAGDVLRRLVARTLAQEFAKEFDQACAPFQFALTTRAGTECVSHMLQAITDNDAEATIVSIDGVSAFDLVSRASMLSGLRRLPKASSTLPFVKQFYGRPSEYVWYDGSNTPQIIQQAEGGEQGDPMMPALYALAQHPALAAVAAQLRPGEQVFAFLDDVYIVCRPDRASLLFNLVQQELHAQCGISVNLGKTKVYNRAGIQPTGFENMGTAEDPARVGDHRLPPEQQGLTILGVPLGHRAYVQARMREIRREHDISLERLQSVPDLQSAWLILSMCASTRANFYLRTLQPSLSADFAAGHDQAVWECFCKLLEREATPNAEMEHAKLVAQLPMRLGGPWVTISIQTQICSVLVFLD